MQTNFYSFSESGNLKEKDFQILKTGKFFYKPLNKEVEITKDDLINFKTNFDNRVRRIDIPVNYEHGESKAHGTKAAGWIMSLSIKNEGSELWASPRWTPEGFKSISEDEFRYFSAELLSEYVDNETGKTYKGVLTGCALTNTPVIKGMSAINALDLSEFKVNEKIETKELIKMNRNELILKMSEIGIDFIDLEKRANKAVELSDKVNALEVKFSEIQKASNELKIENAKLVSEIAESNKKNFEIKLSELIKTGMSEGKLTKSFAEGKFSEIASKQGLEFAESMLSEMPKTINMENQGHGQEGNVDKSKDSALVLSEKASKLSEEKKISFSEALKEVMKSEKDLTEQWKNKAS
jgi:phage I-like protein